MGPRKTRPALTIDSETYDKLVMISRSRTEPARRVERAGIILGYYQGDSVSELARRFRTNRPKIERCIDKALAIGPLAALDDIKRSGRPARITDEAKAWLIHLACQRPMDRGYPHELWTTQLLAQHAREHCVTAEHPSLGQLNRGTVSKILNSYNLKPHKVRYFLESKDPEFEQKMAQVLYVYREVSLARDSQGSGSVVYLSYDAKPGIQAIGNIRPDRHPIPGIQGHIGRDSEYKRYGTINLMAGIDLLTGQINYQIVDRNRSQEFVSFLQILDSKYPSDKTIRLILDNHSTHISKETQAYLKTKPNRFDFVFTPKHGSWLNLVESFFSKLSRCFLRGIRVNSKPELKERISDYLDELNQDPVVFRWNYKIDEASVIPESV